MQKKVSRQLQTQRRRDGRLGRNFHFFAHQGSKNKRCANSREEKRRTHISQSFQSEKDEERDKKVFRYICRAKDGISYGLMDTTRRLPSRFSLSLVSVRDVGSIFHYRLLPCTLSPHLYFRAPILPKVKRRKKMDAQCKSQSNGSGRGFALGLQLAPPILALKHTAFQTGTGRREGEVG